MENNPIRFFGDRAKLSFKKGKTVWIGLAALCLLGLLIFLSQEPKKHSSRTKVVETDSDQKNLYSKAEIESLIKEKSLEEMEKKETQNPRQQVSTPQRKLNSKIAVFIKEEIKQNAREVGPQKDKTRQIPTGVKVKAHLANAIFSFNVSSPVLAITDEDVTKDDAVVLPKNTQFVGDAGIVKSRDRVNIRFSTMVLPDGKEVKIRAMALGLDGSGGIKGKVDKQYDKSLFRAAGETVLAGASLVLGAQNRALTLEDELRLNAARNLTDDAHQALNNVKVEESISVEAYTPLLVLFLEQV